MRSTILRPSSREFQNLCMTSLSQTSAAWACRPRPLAMEGRAALTEGEWMSQIAGLPLSKYVPGDLQMRRCSCLMSCCYASGIFAGGLDQPHLLPAFISLVAVIQVLQLLQYAASTAYQTMLDHHACGRCMLKHRQT